MEKDIENISLKFTCNADWEQMQAVDGARFCTLCAKKVYDFTYSKQDEFLKILAENNNTVCGRFLREQTVPKHKVIVRWKKWASAAMVLIGVNLFNQKAHAQDEKLRILKQSSNSKAPEFYTGIVGNQHFDKVAEFPGGFEGFSKFLSKNLHYVKGMATGRLILAFDVASTGMLTNIHIIRGLSKLNNVEALRAISLSPKWKPAIKNGKPVASSYTVPLIFEK